MLDIIFFYALGVICAAAIALLLPLILPHFKGLKASFGITFVLSGIACYIAACAVYIVIDSNTDFMLYIIERNLLSMSARLYLIVLIICCLVFAVSACMLPLFGGWRNTKLPLGIALLLHMLLTLQPIYYAGIAAVIEKSLTGNGPAEAAFIYALGIICFAAIALSLRVLMKSFYGLKLRQGALFSLVGAFCGIAGLALFALLNALVPLSQLTQHVALRYYILVLAVSGIIYLATLVARVLFAELRNSNIPLYTGLLMHLLLCFIPVIFAAARAALGFSAVQ